MVDMMVVRMVDSSGKKSADRKGNSLAASSVQW